MLANMVGIKEMIIPFIIALILGPIIIPLLKKLEIGQSVREDGPKSHYGKSGTPTMGGIIFFIALVIALIVTKNINQESIIILIGTLGFGFIGFIDDFLIVVRKNNDGLSARNKIIGQVILAFILSYWYYKTSNTEIIVPFLNKVKIDIGFLYIPFMMFVLVAVVNSVNLTDGLDGLASGVTFLVLIFFGIIGNKMGHGNVSSFSYILAGACLGFLFHNSHPAKVFMGDTGSMGLGGAVGSIVMIMDLPLILPLVGGIYFAEALSVILQVMSFKMTGKRLFLMAPLHHHYEQKGLKETKVVGIFWSVTLLLCILGYISLRYWW